jgi:hypothetical protein
MTTAPIKIAAELPPLPPLMERALKAAKSTRSLTVLSLADMRELCRLAVVQHDLISGISMVCTASVERHLAIEPASLQNAIINAFADITQPSESKAS